MTKGKIPGVRGISMNQVRKLLKLPWVIDEALSTFGTAHVLEDGRVVRHTRGDMYGTLYASREAMEEMNRSLAESEREAVEQRAHGLPEPCLKLLPPIDDFIRDVDTYAKGLGKAIKAREEALDGSVASLDAVDKALRRIPRVDRPVPAILTPLMAYVGEVMRKATGGRWSKRPKPPHEERVPIYDVDALLAYSAARRKLQPIAIAAAEEAAAAAKARGASAQEAEVAFILAQREAFKDLEANAPGPIRVEVRKDNEPMITASNGRILQPFPLLFIPMIEPDEYRPVRIAVESDLHGNGYPVRP
jgi:hypothetical protein